MTPAPPPPHRPAATAPTVEAAAPPPARNGRPAEPSANGHSPQIPAPALVPIGSADPALIAQSLRDAQENLVALQRLGAQTAELHRMFLEGQDKAQRTFQSLLNQQQRLTLVSLGLAPAPAPQPSPAPPCPDRQPADEPALAVTPRVEPLSDRVRPAPPSSPRSETGALAPPREPSTAPPAPLPATGDVRFLSILLEVVSEKTGYPPEMLDPAMQLDADLGIDSIKRVEILSALQERLPGAPAVGPEHLGSLRTLQDIVDFLAGGDSIEPAEVATGPATEPAGDPAGQVRSVLLEVVSEKTGYPAEMLDPAMQLDADLGIDSIKRVEILSALQERLPGAPAVGPEQLGTLRTLQDISEFLAGPVTSVQAVADVTTGTGNGGVDAVRSALLEVVSEKTGYPAEMLDPAMQLDADLGIDSIKRVEILSALQERLPDAPAVGPEQLGTLRTLQDIVDFLAEDSRRVRETHRDSTTREDGAFHAPYNVPAPAAPNPAEPAAVQRLVVESVRLPDSSPGETFALRAGGEVWVADDGGGLAAALAERLAQKGYRPRVVGWDEADAVAGPERLDGLVLVAPRSGEGDRLVRDAFRWLRLTGPGLRRAGREAGALAVTVCRLDGAFGARDLADHPEPALGGLAGLIKTAGHEWPEVRCKAIDLDPRFGDAGAVFEELFRPGPVEVGLTPEGRNAPALRPAPIPPDRSLTPALGAGDLVVITGGARGVTAEVAVALSEAFRPTLLLLGRSPSPQAEPDWLAPLRGEAEIKRALAARANGHGTPQLVGEQFRALAANREVLRNLGRIEAAGARAVYRAVDVRDAGAVRDAVAEARAALGPVRGLVHGAGVLADRRIDDQTDAQFAEVYATKVAGLRNLLGAAGDDELKALVLFSSSTARFGRAGQVAYAAANEALNKYARREARRRPGCRVVAVNWGPWDGGMVTPSLKPLFASEGIGLIPLADGARYLVREIAAAEPERPAEVVVLGEGSAVPSTPSPAAEPSPKAEPPALTTVFERPLDLDALPVLRSHVIDGRAVLPMALMVEWLAHGAIQRNPGLAFCGVDDLRVLKGAILHDDRPESVAVLVGKAARDGGLFRVPVELRGVLGGGKTVAHARGHVVLADRPPTADGPTVDTAGVPHSTPTPRSVYHDVLFHGPDLQGLERIEALGPEGASALVRTAPAPSEWLDRPLRKDWLTDPLAIDCAFQLLSVWCSAHAGAVSLPTLVGRYRQFRRSFPAPRVRVAARVSRPAPHRAVADIEFLDPDGALVARIEGYECVIDASLNQAFRRNRLHQVARRPR
jgi:NAD(P)-dependent dehydrogenase (short-subunit alcohol dehydrogenase family)/acyl carrier protein